MKLMNFIQKSSEGPTKLRSDDLPSIVLSNNEMQNE